MPWRKKMMPLSEWEAFQRRFGDIQLAMQGDPSLALFVQGQLGDKLSAIFMTGPDLQALEMLSPGGWEDSSAPSGAGISLLVGTADSWKLHQVNQAL